MRRKSDAHEMLSPYQTFALDKDMSLKQKQGNTDT
jgi:hypothetical protein